MSCINEDKRGPVISIPRGDDKIYPIGMRYEEDGTTYTPAADDTIIFSVKPAEMNAEKTEYLETDPIIVKNIDPTTMELHLEPADTADLGFGTYLYDLFYIRAEDGWHETIIKVSPFVVGREVHSDRGE